MKKTFLLFVAVVFVVLTFAGCGGGVDNSSPEAVTRSYTKAAISGDVNALMACFTPERQEMIMANAAEDLTDGQKLTVAYIVGDAISTLKNMEISVNNVEVDGDRAILYADVTRIWRDGTSDQSEARMECVRIDGKWYVNE